MPATSKGDLPAPGAQALAPAYYAPPSTGWRRDLLALLHPPYTAWHLSYVVIGASLAPRLDLLRLAATLVAFFFAVGVSAHALDELHGRPLRTSVPSSVLIASAAIGLVIAVGLGIAGVTQVGVGLLAFIALGVLFVLRPDGAPQPQRSRRGRSCLRALVRAAKPQHSSAPAAATQQRSRRQCDPDGRNAHRPRPASTAQTARAGAESVLVGCRGACDGPGGVASGVTRRLYTAAR